MTMTVAREAIPFGDGVVFTGHVLREGHPGRLVRVRLLERLSTGDGAWRVVAVRAFGWQVECAIDLLGNR
jgi:hypothetical protein